MIVFFFFLLLTSIRAQSPTPTGYSNLCQSCMIFLEQLPGFMENYSPVTGIDATTLCTSLAHHMPSLGQPCFKLFAEYWPAGTNATTIQICDALYFC
ncbi:hypothetical protein GCK72_021817 [Caenorhabditis remanei]|uniref:Saposin B-type domain-containing protein n=1 Tax=Caenorhabditis remanei TaxID=31234 RepID=A0A6A5GJ56_CAERE|nr:hypothetical protein GCK72_021817 [Caenorhabditis remanei]KAF1755248.1 hypothetical protein GCK72_021817 [Caenorhabditis remanei]